jgi:hypothetical protein
LLIRYSSDPVAPPTKPEALWLGYEVTTGVVLVNAVDTSELCSDGLSGNTGVDVSLYVW